VRIGGAIEHGQVARRERPGLGWSGGAGQGHGHARQGEPTRPSDHFENPPKARARAAPTSGFIRASGRWGKVVEAPKLVQCHRNLLFDVSHVKEAVNTAPNNPADWRKTVWEVHPITSMQVLP
jgi:ribosomal protein L15